jgi:eukaryotic-like serine/threonine-protein kinase
VGFFDGLKKMFGGGGGGPGAAPRRKAPKRFDISKRFDLRGRTGQGSMSKVYQAYDNKLGRTVCLKLLDKEKTDKFEERFKIQGLNKPSEGDICLNLRHPNLLVTFEHGLTLKGEPFLVLEWIEGLGLNYLIETRNAQLNGNRVNYMCQLADAIAYLHGQRFLHRDLCPRNVMVTKEGVVKLIDFGLTIPYTPEYCKPGNRTGTADYLAPEIIKRMSTDHRVDVFALGVTAFEVFTGQLPWERSLSSEETLRRHLNTPPRNPSELNPDLDEEVSRVLLKAIERDVKARYPTAIVFKEALEKLERQDY